MSEPTPELAKALAKVQSQLPSIRKSSTADVESKTGRSFKFKYADLDDVSQTILPLLGQNGLSFTALPTLSETGFVLHYELMHVSGEAKVGDWLLPDPTTHKPQDVGSAITYARRYCLCAATGVTSDEDDDGRAAEHTTAARAQQRAQVPPQRQAERNGKPKVDWDAEIRACHNDVDRLRELWRKAAKEGWLDHDGGRDKLTAVLAAVRRAAAEQDELPTVVEGGVVDPTLAKLAAEVAERLLQSDKPNIVENLTRNRIKADSALPGCDISACLAAKPLVRELLEIPASTPFSLAQLSDSVAVYVANNDHSVNDGVRTAAAERQRETAGTA